MSSMPGEWTTDSEDGDFLPSATDDEVDAMEVLEAMAEEEEAAGDFIDPDDEEEELEPTADAEAPTGDDPIRIVMDPSNGRVYLVEGENTIPLSATLLRRAPGLRALLQRHLGGRADLPGADDDDDEEDEDWGPRRRTGGNREPFFHVVTEPRPEGLLLERGGEFGKTPRRLMEGRRALSSLSTNVNDILRKREGKWRPPARQDLGQICLPNSVGAEVCRYDANIYCGQYSKDGSFYYTCAQDFRIRIYDTTQSPSTSIRKGIADRDNITSTPNRGMPHRPYGRYGGEYSEDKSSLKLIKSVQAHDARSRWTITDGNLSPNNDALIYSTIGPVVNHVKTREGDTLEGLGGDASEHTQLNFASGSRGDFGIWSIRFSADAKEIVAGANHGSIFLYDIERQQTTLRVPAHNDDVNAVCFADEMSSNVLVSGSDDSLIKIWDRRSMRGQTPSGVLVGHTEGITFVSPKGDNRYVVSNGKDQTAKLWDLRKLYSAEAAQELRPRNAGVPGFDYRGPLYRKPRHVKHPNDVSVSTFTGHAVLQTLIRCHFSPASSTGQRYIYSGSSDGRIHVWGLDGQVVNVLDRRDVKPITVDPFLAPRSTSTAQPTPNPHYSSGTTVRDVSWHPLRPEMLSTSWESRGGSSGSVVLHRSVI